MRFTLFVLLMAATAPSMAQDIIGTPDRLVLMFNYPGNYFYFEIPGKEKLKTKTDGLFRIDGKPVQVLLVNHDKFLAKKDSSITSVSAIEKYIQYELSYLKELYKVDLGEKKINGKTTKGIPHTVWYYNSPISTGMFDEKSPTVQLYGAINCKNLIIGVYAPVYKEDKLEERIRYMQSIMNSLVKSDKPLDQEALKKQYNQAAIQPSLPAK